jgi:hypothetical protein
MFPQTGEKSGIEPRPKAPLKGPAKTAGDVSETAGGVGPGRPANAAERREADDSNAPSMSRHGVHLEAVIAAWPGLPHAAQPAIVAVVNSYVR